MFSFQKPALPYDPARQRPVLRVSICTGEQVAGLEDRKTGAFEDIMLIRSPKDLRRFLQKIRRPARKSGAAVLNQFCLRTMR